MTSGGEGGGVRALADARDKEDTAVVRAEPISDVSNQLVSSHSGSNPVAFTFTISYKRNNFNLRQNAEKG